jgi:hypothetical protein
MTIMESNSERAAESYGFRVSDMNINNQKMHEVGKNLTKKHENLGGEISFIS